MVRPQQQHQKAGGRCLWAPTGSTKGLNASACARMCAAARARSSKKLSSSPASSPSPAGGGSTPSGSRCSWSSAQRAGKVDTRGALDAGRQRQQQRQLQGQPTQPTPATPTLCTQALFTTTHHHCPPTHPHQPRERYRQWPSGGMGRMASPSGASTAFSSRSSITRSAAGEQGGHHVFIEQGWQRGAPAQQGASRGLAALPQLRRLRGDAAQHNKQHGA